MGIRNAVKCLIIEDGGAMELRTVRNDRIDRIDSKHVRLYLNYGKFAKYSPKIRKGRGSIWPVWDIGVIPPVDIDQALRNPEIIQAMILGASKIIRPMVDGALKDVMEENVRLRMENKNIKEKARTLIKDLKDSQTASPILLAHSEIEALVK